MVSPPIIVWPTRTRGFTPSEINIRPAAEADDAKAFTGHQAIALMRGADDAACDQARDLHAGQVAPIEQLEAGTLRSFSSRQPPGSHP